jgi:6-pyruvoyl-tetrahydropterin synthase
MTMRMHVFARTRFVAFHRWKDAPIAYGYLGNIHRHEFHVEVGVHVDKEDRQVEFHQLKRQVEHEIASLWPSRRTEWPLIEESCEAMATRIADRLNGVASGSGKLLYQVDYVEVSEDGECGGRVIFDE